jgi:PhnB protein
MPRVSTYLNFPGTTEKAFTFYKAVFQNDFNGPVVRFKDGPADGPPLSETEQNMILHMELPILGGHVLMGTDAPESMGMAVNAGNNVHINLEPDTREETLRLFNALAEGGQISMPLQDMFWGAYFGSVTDRFGICWMVNCSQAG